MYWVSLNGIYDKIKVVRIKMQSFNDLVKLNRCTVFLERNLDNLSAKTISLPGM